MGSSTSVAAICATRSRTVGIPSGRCRPSPFGMYRRRTGGGRYVPARSTAASSCSMRSTPYCSTSASVSPSTPAAPRFRRHTPPRLPEDVSPPNPIHQSVEAPFRRSLGCDPESALQLAHFVNGRMPVGVVGTGRAGHALARACVTDRTTAGTLGSSRVLRREVRRYYGPLGRPLRTSRFHHRFIRAALPRLRAAQTGLSCSASLRARVLRPIPRRDPRRVHLRTGAPQAWPSPRRDRLGSRVVTLTRLQASLDVAARVLALSRETCDTPLEPRDSHRALGVGYSALRCLPRRDLHPLEEGSVE